MSKNITIELDEKYAEHLELLKQIIPDEEWNPITEDGKMIEALVDSFLAFLNEQADAHNHGDEEKSEGWCCGGGSCGSH